MINSLTYLTRRCPRKCEYCALRDAKGLGPELSPQQWIEAFNILKELGVQFNLILGNETWLLGEDLLTILYSNKVPFALYTTAPEPLWTNYRKLFFDSGVLDNLSCGMDYPIIDGVYVSDDSYHKSVSALEAFKWIKKYYPNVDTQGNITVHKKNLQYIPLLVTQLSQMGVFVGMNFIHWNSDGKFDFFPGKEQIADLLFSPEDFPEIVKTLNRILQNPGLLQNPEILQIIANNPSILLMKWHCCGNPYGGPSIDSDGKLRVCGYRVGERTNKLSIFDLPKKYTEWEEAVYLDAMECPGCNWAYPMMVHYWEATDNGMGREVFVKHAGNHIDKSKWSKRLID
jgi:MoaA/NifB/PqqE/SkfB family radical SAM enzyme